MSVEQRPATGTSGRSKRRGTEPEEDGKATGEPKRQRVSRACDSCRSKKDKCDGKQPVCSTCASLCRPCTYKTNPKKRGLPTGYIRSLEILWGLVFQRIRGSEDVIRALMRSINLPSHLAAIGKEAEGSDTLMASFKNSTVLRDIERILVVLEQPEEEREQNLQGYGENDPPLDVSRILSSAEVQEWQLPEGIETRETQFPGVSSNQMSTGISPTLVSRPRPTRDCGVQASPSDDLPSTPSTSPSNPNASQLMPTRLPLQLPYNAWPLFDIYFSYTQCWFPILEKHDILRTAFQYTEGDVHISNLAPGSGEHAALWAVLTLASLQDASISATRQINEPPANQTAPSQIYTIARNMIPTESGPYEIGHVQALLILGLVKFGQQDWTGSWMLVGQAVRIAYILGLHQPSNSSTLKTPDQVKHLGRAKHVFLGCFVLETLIAESASRCPSLRKVDLTGVGSINEDGLEEWHPWEDQTGLRPAQTSRASMQRGPLHALSTFNYLVSLVSILNELCCCRHDPETSQSQLEQLELQLQRWATTLPRTYRVDLQSHPARLASPHIFGLEITYESVVTALSYQIAIREYAQTRLDPPHKIRAVESSKRILQLLQVYMDTYSLSATAPILGMMLQFSLPPSLSRDLLSDHDVELRDKVHNVSSQLSILWKMPDRQVVNQNIFQGSHVSRGSPSRSQYIDSATGEDIRMPPSFSTTPTPHYLPPIHSPQQNPHAAAPLTESYLTAPWFRTTQHIENVALLPTVSPIAPVRSDPEVTAQQNRLGIPVRNDIRHQTSIPNRLHHDASILAELSPSYQSTAHYHPTTYPGPSLNTGGFVDMGSYEPPQRQRIAPDLDALFDELASLDGAEKPDNQPEFMQNLGFVSEAGIPELYSFSDPIEPFLLAQTQQLPNNAPPSRMDQEALP